MLLGILEIVDSGEIVVEGVVVLERLPLELLEWEGLVVELLEGWRVGVCVREMRGVLLTLMERVPVAEAVGLRVTMRVELEEGVSVSQKLAEEVMLEDGDAVGDLLFLIVPVDVRLTV